MHNKQAPTIHTLTKKISDYESKDSIGSKMRAKRIAPLRQQIIDVFNQHGFVSIIDIGGTQRYWNIIPLEFLKQYKVSITIVNLPCISKPENNGPFLFEHGNACDLKEFETNAFHIAHSNSVIEHVGDWANMAAYAQELKRVASKYFVQTPNYWFPIEPHCMTPFFHWLPKPMRIWLVLKFSVGNWPQAKTVDKAVRLTESARLLNKRMFCALFDDAHIITEKAFLLSKSHVAIRG